MSKKEVEQLIGMVSTTEWNPLPLEEVARLEREVERLTQRAADARREALAEAIDLIEQRAAQRGRQVDVAQNEGGAWEVVAGKSSELQAVADLLRRRLPVLTPSA